MMVGIVVSNGVLLVDFANVLRARGKPLIEATIDAGRTRLRPILMTTVATIVGLIPMALGIGEGSETNLPLARAVIGGLAVSTVFTLFLVPALYTALERFSKRSHAPERRRRHRRGRACVRLVAGLVAADSSGSSMAARTRGCAAGGREGRARCRRPARAAAQSVGGRGRAGDRARRRADHAGARRLAADPDGQRPLHPSRSRPHAQTTTTTDTGEVETHVNRVAAANQVSGNLQLTVPLVAAPAWTATGRAKSAKRTAEASATDVRRQVAQSTARAFITVVAQHRLVAASETARDTAKAHYDYAHTRLQGGIGRAIDEVRAQQDLATVDTQLQANLARLAVAREALGVLVGTDGPVDAIDEVDLPAPPSMADAVAGARTNRTDVQVARHEGRVGEARRGRHLGLLHALPGRGRDAVRAVPGVAHAARAGLAGAAGADAADLRRRPAQRHLARARRGSRRDAFQSGGGAAPGAGGDPRATSRRWSAPTWRWRRPATPPASRGGRWIWRTSPTRRARRRTWR